MKCYELDEAVCRMYMLLSELFLTQLTNGASPREMQLHGANFQEFCCPMQGVTTQWAQVH